MVTADETCLHYYKPESKQDISNDARRTHYAQIGTNLCLQFFGIDKESY